LKTDVAILDFGSQKLTALIGSLDVNNTLNVKVMSSENYEGFLDGDFIEPANLEKAIFRTISGVEKVSNFKVSSLVVGVPTEFCISKCNTVSQNFLKPKRIVKKDIDALFLSAQADVPNFTVINKDSLYYVLGDNIKIKNPVGQFESKISACLSFVYAKNSFLVKVSNILNKLGIFKITFVSSVFAQSLYLFDEEVRDRYVLLVDCGYITTSVALIRGNGILNLSSFSLGGGFISADLSKCLKIPFSSAEELLKKVVLCIEPEEADNYEIIVDGQVVPVSMKVANAIVESRIEMIAQGIKKCFNLWQYNFPDFIPINLTGGGLSFIKGARDVLSKLTGKNIEITKLPYSQFNKTNFSSALSVLNFALTNKNK
jgi:cell division protein FtsA